MKISFDFDNTLQYKIVQDKAKELIKLDHNICIVTTRFSNVTKYGFEATNNDLFSVAKDLGITEIHFTEYEWKYTCIDQWDINFHIDDNYRDEVTTINHNCKTKAIWFPGHGTKWYDELLEEMSKL